MKMRVRSLVLMVLLAADVCGVLDYCIFGAGCPFQCHCSPAVVQPPDDCDNITGVCPGNNCVMYQGKMEGTTYTPWYNPGCQLGDVGLEKVIDVYDLANRPLPIQYTIKTPYGNTDPLICLYPDSPFQLSDLQFVLDFEQTVYLVLLTVSAKHETKTLFEAYHNGSCQYVSYVSDSIDDKREELQCETIYPSYKDALYFACNKKGRYLILTAKGCSLREYDVQNLCIEFVSTFGYSVQNVECSKCLKNDSTVMTTNIQSYIEVFNDHLLGTVAENKTLSVYGVEPLTCGNGIWCEICEAGWMPPDCLNPCQTGFYGGNCSEQCSNIPVSELYHCRETQNCHHVTGEFLNCSGGCELWYTGSQCTHYIAHLDSGHVISNLLSGHNVISLQLEFEVDSDLVDFYSYMIEYSYSNDQFVHFYPLLLLPTPVLQVVELTELDTAHLYNFRILANRQDHGVRESVISGAFSITTGCLHSPQVDIYDQKDLYISWLPNGTLASCGQVEVNAVFVKQSDSDTWKKYAVSPETNVLLLQNMAEDVDEVRIQGDSNHGYQVMSKSVLVMMPDTPNRETEDCFKYDTFRSWHINYLVILVLTFSVAFLIVLIILVICMCRKTPVQQQDIKMDDYLNSPQPGPVRYVNDPVEREGHLPRSPDLPPAHAVYHGEQHHYEVPFQDDRPQLPARSGPYPGMPASHFTHN